jgi:autotransporter-associated beta strand protein
VQYTCERLDMNFDPHPREAHLKITHTKLIPRYARTDGRAKRFHLLSMAAAVLLVSLAPSNAFAGSATWAPSSGATVGDWNTASNWSPQTVPNGFSDVATFAHSFTTGVSISSSVVVNGITFASSMFPSAYTITTTSGGELQISGSIVNNSGLTQNFVIDESSTLSEKGILFQGSATAGSGTIFTTNGGTVGSPAGNVRFYQLATAASGTFINNGTIDLRAPGGFTAFLEGSSAGSATLIANAGATGGNGGRIILAGVSTGGTARVEVSGNGAFYGNGSFEVDAHNAPGVSVGSIEGNGNVFLGSNNLTVGSNNLSTTFSGVIQDGGFAGGTGGSLSKIGKGKLTLNFPSTYTGGTTINKGMLLVKNTSGSATGSGPVQVSGGTLEGTGIIAGAVTVGTGVGTTSKANLLAGNGATSPGTLTINNPATFQSDSTYKCVLNRSSGKASKLTAFGVTINNSAQFALTTVGTGTLTVGTVFRVIDNTSNLAISGRFRNLSNGLVLTSNDGTKFKVNYTGGTDNDLTLKVVP